MAGGIKVYTGQDGSIRDVFDAYKNGDLTPTTVANAGVHAGMGGAEEQLVDWLVPGEVDIKRCWRNPVSKNQRRECNDETA